MTKQDYIDFCKSSKINIVTIDCAEEHLLTTDALKCQFVIVLEEIICRRHPKNIDDYQDISIDAWELDHLWAMTHATPQERAEAVLRVIGEWEEVKDPLPVNKPHSRFKQGLLIDKLRILFQSIDKSTVYSLKGGLSERFGNTVADVRFYLGKPVKNCEGKNLWEGMEKMFDESEHDIWETDPEDGCLTLRKVDSVDKEVQ